MARRSVVEQVVEFTQARWRDQPQQRGVVIDLRKQLDPDLQPAVVALALVLGTTAGLAFSTVA